MEYYYEQIVPTEHYLYHHAKDMPWTDVLRIMIITKNRRKKGDVFEIETDEHYIVFAVRDRTAFVINAKRKRQ